MISVIPQDDRAHVRVGFVRQVNRDDCHDSLQGMNGQRFTSGGSSSR
jgi:hypothetical protein